MELVRYLSVPAAWQLYNGSDSKRAAGCGKKPGQAACRQHPYYQTDRKFWQLSV